MTEVIEVAKPADMQAKVHPLSPIWPTHDNLVIIEFKETNRVTAGGIALPDTYEDGPGVGIVIAAGPGSWGISGYLPMEYQVNDLVFMFSERPFERVPIGDIDYMIIRQIHMRGKMMPTHPEYKKYQEKDPWAAAKEVKKARDAREAQEGPMFEAALQQYQGR